MRQPRTEFVYYCSIEGWVAAAIAGGAVLTAGATAYAGSQAASATKSATNAAIGEENAALGQQAQLAAPYENLGTAAIGQYENLLGIGPNGQPASAASGAAEQKALAATPGYQFTLQQGTQNTLNAASASGIGVSGNTLEGIDQYTTGLADSTYQNAVGNAEGAVGLGQAAAAGQASNIGTAAGNISSDIINQGNTLAGIDTNTIAGITKAGSNAVDQGIFANTLAGLNQPALQPYVPQAQPWAIST
jgi:hypothetical protein